MKDMVLIGLDRDETINADPEEYFGRDADWKDKLEIYSDAFTGIRIFNTQPLFRIAVCTNQAAGIARGFYSYERAVAVNEEIDRRLQAGGARVDSWHISPFYTPAQAARRGLPSNKWVKENKLRKPEIGMLEEACDQLNLRLKELAHVYFVGDRTTDVLTGINAGGKGILIRGRCEKPQEEGTEVLREGYPGRVHIVDTLAEAANWIIADYASLTK